MKQWLLTILYMLCIAVLMSYIIDYARKNPITDEIASPP